MFPRSFATLWMTMGESIIILPSREGVGGVLEGILMDNKVDKVDVYHTPLPLSRGDLKPKLNEFCKSKISWLVK